MQVSRARARTKTGFVTSDHNPLRIRKGDVIFVGHHDGQYLDYVWGGDESGRAAWVPESYLEMRGGHEAVALRDYDSTELTVARGDELDVIDEAGGWCLCRTPGGVSGWLPSAIVEPI